MMIPRVCREKGKRRRGLDKPTILIWIGKGFGNIKTKTQKEAYFGQNFKCRFTYLSNYLLWLLVLQHRHHESWTVYLW